MSDGKRVLWVVEVQHVPLSHWLPELVSSLTEDEANLDADEWRKVTPKVPGVRVVKYTPGEEGG